MDSIGAMIGKHALGSDRSLENVHKCQLVRPINHDGQTNNGRGVYSKVADLNSTCDESVFVAEPKFTGRKLGYKFQVGPSGLGYYPDSVQPHPVMFCSF